jgi:hypothetical protein
MYSQSHDGTSHSRNQTSPTSSPLMTTGSQPIYIGKTSAAYDALYTCEYALYDCSSLLESKVNDFIRSGNATDLDMGWWLLCFALDVNGEIAFSKRFGHPDEGKDIGDIAGALAERLDYCAHVGVYPSLHPWFWMVIKALTAVLKQIDYTIVFIEQRMAEHKAGRNQSAEKGQKGDNPVDILTRFFDTHYGDPKAFKYHDVMIGAYSSKDALLAGCDPRGATHAFTPRIAAVENRAAGRNNARWQVLPRRHHGRRQHMGRPLLRCICSKSRRLET